MSFVDFAAQSKQLGTAIEESIGRVLAHGQFILGPEVFQLETALAAGAGVGHCVTCGSGTDALLLAILSLGVKPGDAVLVPAFTFAATAEVVALIGATPVFVDVRADSFNLDAESLVTAVGEARRQGLRPVGVIPVDLFGQPADYVAIGEVAADEGLWVLADAAQSLGATVDGRPVGSLAGITTTSFFPAKPLGCYGDGGAIFTNDDEQASMLRSLRVHGQGENKYDNIRIGLNGRLDTIQAAILLAKLAIFPGELQARRLLADTYTRALSGAVDVPSVVSGVESAWAQYTVQVDQRDEIAARLTSAGVPTAVYYPKPLHRQVAYSRFPTSPGGCPAADRMSSRVLSLPIHPYLSADAQQRVVQALLSASGPS